ncbi:MAG: hypothetical protein LBT80_01585 [Lactobacillaceae bacterium]|jgi:hypothetical protein|nr:hypothetical protein [Lactobacillaceae bacterium]
MTEKYYKFNLDDYAEIIEMLQAQPRWNGKRRWWEKHDMPFDPIRPLWKRIFNVF